MGVDCPDFPKIHLTRPHTGPRWLVLKPCSRLLGNGSRFDVRALGVVRLTHAENFTLRVNSAVWGRKDAKNGAQNVFAWAQLSLTGLSSAKKNRSQEVARR